MPPKIDMSREEAAEREIGVTRFSGGVKILLVAVFLGSILAIPCIQATRGFGLSWGAETKPDSSGVLGRLAAVSHFWKTGFQGIEDSLEKNSFLTKTMLPAMQTVAFRYFGLGNEKVYVSRGGWLFYRPDVDYVLEGAIKPVPLIAAANKALAQLDAELKSNGIRLVVLPVPVKPVVEVGELASIPASLPLHNASYQKFLDGLRADGIEVFDPTDLLLKAGQSRGVSQYLKTDTHWTPAAMDLVAGALANKINPTATPSSAWRKSAPVKVKNTGDLAVMLQLLPGATAALAEKAEIQPVTLPDGSAWQPDSAAEVLLLGDSFTNIFSTADLGWGESAGLAEQLSWHLGKPVDRIAINAGGSLSVRQELARNPARLDGKKIIVYQFAVRELTSGDWRPVTIPAVAKAVPSRETTGQIQGVIKAVSRLPAPGSVPYKDALISLHLGEINGDADAEALVFLKGMTANVPTEAAALQAGAKISLGVVPWERVESRYGSITRIELEGEAAELDTVYWAEKTPVVVEP
ncbi:MAG: alginate O-acetyltransferase AlgX-related protein [Spartobacteria bacterium]